MTGRTVQVGAEWAEAFRNQGQTIKQAEQPQAEPFVPTDPDLSPNESIKIVPFAKGNKIQVRTVKQEGEEDDAWIMRTNNLYQSARKLFSMTGIIE